MNPRANTTSKGRGQYFNRSKLECFDVTNLATMLLNAILGCLMIEKRGRVQILLKIRKLKLYIWLFKKEEKLSQVYGMWIQVAVTT